MVFTRNLTPDDLYAMRHAHSAYVFANSEAGGTAFVRLRNDRLGNELQRRIFNGDEGRVIPAAFYGISSGAGFILRDLGRTDPLITGGCLSISHVEMSLTVRQDWTRFAAAGKPGSFLTVRGHADHHTNTHVAKAGLSADVVTLDIYRDRKHLAELNFPCPIVPSSAFNHRSIRPTDIHTHTAQAELVRQATNMMETA